jgi:hypothetical protein
MRIDDVFDELENAVVQQQEISCHRSEKNGRIKWVIEILDPETAETFQVKMNAFLDRLKQAKEGLNCL